MPKSTLTITTTVDGKETQISPKGTLEADCEAIVVNYHDGDSETQVSVKKDSATIVRRGDYGMALTLVKGAKTQGELTVSGSVGKIEIFTHLIEYSKKSNKYLITLRYDLLFGGEPQKMQVRIFAKNNG